MRPTPTILIVLCPGIAVGALGAWVFAAGARAAIFGLLSRRWPVVRGQITESRVAETSKGASLLVRYAYEVDSVAHAGSTVGFAAPGTRWNSTVQRAEVRASEQRYAVGREVDVFYWPARSSVSVLEPGFHGASVILMTMGGAWLGVAAGVCSLAFLSYR